MDYAFGELKEVMETENIFDDTMIILTADHGEEFWEHNNRGHGHCLYPEVIRVPLIIYLPRDDITTDNKRIDNYVSLVDISPTILDYLNLPGQDAMDGESLIPIIESELTDIENDITSNPPVFTENIQYPFRTEGLDGERKSIYKDNYHLIYDFTTEKTELYHIPEDIPELNNLSELNEKKNDELFRELMKWYEDNLLIKKSLSPPQEIQLTDEEKEMLRGLGYVIDR